MSITFSSNGSFETSSKEEPCMCSQMAPNWCAALQGGLEPHREELRAHARPDCSACNGAGVEAVRTHDGPSVNWCNGNARIMLEVLGLGGDLYGTVDIATARRALVRARNRDLTSFARPACMVFGAPVKRGSVVELRPLRYSAQELTEDDIRFRIASFEAFIKEATARGATKIFWG